MAGNPFFSIVLDMRIGVLAIQGGYAAHERALQDAGFATSQIKQPNDLKNIDGLVLPGGESSTQLKLLKKQALWEPLNNLVNGGLPVFATCAGVILCADKVENPRQESFAWVPIHVIRNAYGAQGQSFCHKFKWKNRQQQVYFIRAPQVVKVGDGVEIILQHNNMPTLLRYRNILLATFHPELECAKDFYDLIFCAYDPTKAKDHAYH